MCRSSLLEEVTHKAAVTLSPSKTLVVLGDDECGKTTLIARLQGTEDPKKGFGLEYTLLDIKDEDRDGMDRFNSDVFASPRSNEAECVDFGWQHNS